MSGLGFDGQGQSGGLGDGIYVDNAVVQGVLDISGQVTEYQKNALDLALEVTFNLTKNDWTRRITIGGNFQKDSQSEAVTGWGSAFKVRDFLKATGVMNEESKLTDDNKVPADVMQQCLGQSVLLLSYKNDRGKTSTWNRTFPTDVDPAECKRIFLTDFNASGYPRNYAPNALAPNSPTKQQDDDFKYGANADKADIRQETLGDQGTDVPKEQMPEGAQSEGKVADKVDPNLL